MGPIKELYDQGKVAVLHGIGYADSPRSHFRSMDIWHTCEPRPKHCLLYTSDAADE